MILIKKQDRFIIKRNKLQIIIYHRKPEEIKLDDFRTKALVVFKKMARSGTTAHLFDNIKQFEDC